MKVSLWYVLREFRRRPKRFLSLTAVSAAVMSVMILLVLWMEAEWRADVMPEKPNNYHFSFYNLTEADKNYIRSQDWVQATYDIYSSDPDIPAAYVNSFRVRVTWDHVGDAVALARSVMLRRGLFEREPYAELYRREYQDQYEKFLEKWNGQTQNGGTTIEEASAINARSFLLRYGGIKNKYFISKTQNSYIMQPAFFSTLLMFALFFSGATTILILETYRSCFREYGSLRALGCRKSQLFVINLLETLGVNLAAIPIAILFTAGAVQLYYRLTAPYAAAAQDAYFTITDYVPVRTLLVLSGYLIFAALLGALLVCWLYRDKTIMSLLRGEGTFTVSFVSKTSSRFEKARGVGAYSRLYAFRARSTLIRYAVIVAIMMPLPMYYLLVGIFMLTGMNTPSDIVQGVYILFQAVAVLATTLCVTYAASRMSARSRAPELAVLRALGANHQTIRRVTYPTATMQGAAILLLATFINLTISNTFVTETYVASREGAQSAAAVLAELLMSVLSAACFVLPSVYSGLITFLHGFFCRPILTSIREPE
ncbi:MAG: FtsX-like permease family protein [Eubacteriales bacterium]